MGTHPIFESDFDCLTEKVRETEQYSKMGYKVIFILLPLVLASQFKPIKNYRPLDLSSASQIQKLCRSEVCKRCSKILLYRSQSSVAGRCNMLMNSCCKTSLSHMLL